MTKHLSLITLGLFIFGACAYRAQVVRLDPKLPEQTAVPASGQSQEVTLRAKDARSSQVIGRRQSGTANEADITTGEDLSELLKSKISKILGDKGFRLNEAESTGAPVLLVELKELSYESFTEEKIRKVRIRAVLRVFSQQGAKSMERTLTASQERKIPFEPVASSNEDWINETLSDALKEFSRDEKIFSFLREPVARNTLQHDRSTVIKTL